MDFLCDHLINLTIVVCTSIVIYIVCFKARVKIKIEPSEEKNKTTLDETLDKVDKILQIQTLAFEQTNNEKRMKENCSFHYQSSENTKEKTMEIVAKVFKTDMRPFMSKSKESQLKVNINKSKESETEVMEDNNIKEIPEASTVGGKSKESQTESIVSKNKESQTEVIADSKSNESQKEVTFDNKFKETLTEVNPHSKSKESQTEVKFERISKESQVDVKVLNASKGIQTDLKVENSLKENQTERNVTTQESQTEVDVQNKSKQIQIEGENPGRSVSEINFKRQLTGRKYIYKNVSKDQSHSNIGTKGPTKVMKYPGVGVVSKGRIILLNIINPPPSLTAIHKTFLNYISSKGLEVKQDANAPCLVTVANMSRLLSDINRDLNRAKGQISEERIVLVISIKRDAPKSVQPLKSILSEWPSNVSLMVNLIVDPSLKHLHECDHNYREYNKFITNLCK